MQERPPARDHYELLQVTRTADFEVIRAAYRALAQRYHPDLGGSEAQMAALNDAWAVLRDRQARLAYDRQLAIAADRTAAPVDGGAPIITPPPGAGRSGGTTLDYGRYQGWSLAQLARDDPDYLRWLVRTPTGRAYRAEIEALLAGHRPAPSVARPTARGGRFGRVSTATR
ncbi:MAG TPA: DnaJ domain-containing protein [Acidimicrobiales bacterium]|nr:DnaJ domain-containing protein [Acidimicrobiales bacterium]